jgi:3-methylcrotonyl-CoA carboxylase beta subunit
MTVLQSHAASGNLDFQANETEHRRLVAELRERMQRVAQGGGQRARERHLARGKLLPRERVRRLCDPGAPFLELCPLAAEDLYDGEAPGAGVIAGIGLLNGRHALIVANDATVKGGTYYP